MVQEPAHGGYSQDLSITQGNERLLHPFLCFVHKSICRAARARAESYAHQYPLRVSRPRVRVACISHRAWKMHCECMWITGCVLRSGMWVFLRRHHAVLPRCHAAYVCILKSIRIQMVPERVRDPDPPTSSRQDARTSSLRDHRRKRFDMLAARVWAERERAREDHG